MKTAEIFPWVISDVITSIMSENFWYDEINTGELKEAIVQSFSPKSH